MLSRVQCTVCDGGDGSHAVHMVERGVMTLDRY